MKNSAMKRIIAVLLCLVVFAGSELTGLTNIVGNLAATDTVDTAETDYDEATEELNLSEEEPADEGTTEEAPEDVTPPSEDTGETAPEEIPAEIPAEPSETPADSAGAPAETPGDAAVTEGENTETPADPSAGDPAAADPSAEITDAELPADPEQQPAEELPADGQLAEAEEENELEAFEDVHEDDQVVITVEADPGVLPEGARVSAKAVVQQDVEALKADEAVSEEEVAEAEALNAVYEETQNELEASVAEDEKKEIAHFVAYDIRFYAANDDGDEEEVTPDGDILVKMEFKEGILPEAIEEDDEMLLDSVDVVHMKNTEDGLKAEVLTDAEVGMAEDSKVEEAAFTSDDSSIYAIAWVGEAGVYTYEDDEVIIKVAAKDEGAIPEDARLRVVPIVDADETAQQYQEVADQLLEKAEGESYDIAGFLAYDISLVDRDGNELEPAGEVTVTMDYKEAKAPADLTAEAVKLEEEADAQPEEEESADAAVQSEDAEEAQTTEETAGPGTIVIPLGESESQEEAPETGVTVMHLEEDEAGAVAQVVDMAEADKVVEVSTTEKQEVQKVEFTTESFSVFTITWKDGNSVAKSIEITFKDVNDGELYPPAELVEKLTAELTKYNEEFKISEIKEGGKYADIYELTYDGLEYHFERAANIWDDGYDIAKGTEIESLKLSRSGSGTLKDPYDYKVEFKKKGGDWSEGEQDSSWYEADKFYFIYSRTLVDVIPPKTVPTVDNEKNNITMRLINHTDRNSGNAIAGAGGGSGANGLMDEWDEDKKVWKGLGSVTGSSEGEVKSVATGLVENKLSEENGYPVLAQGPNTGRDLSELFSGGETVNNLFLEEKLTNTGYFEYDSSKNYAYLNGNNFEVYEAIGTPLITAGDNVWGAGYKRGNFFPYNQISKSYYSNLTSDGRKLNLTVGAPDYYFGMYMEASFAQPENGKAVHTDPEGNQTSADMIYEFSGDDDLWIFIDDVLVLDMGGIHQIAEGTINFATGEIIVNGAEPVTIAEMYERAGKFWDGETWDEEKKGDYFTDKGTFVDYSTHTLKMFYMERGAGASNLHMKMNLQTIPKDSVSITKQLKDSDPKYADMLFPFQLWAQIPDPDRKGQYMQGEDAYQVVTAKPTVTVKTENGGTKTLPDSEVSFDPITGIFMLKPGQTATFEDLPRNRKYFVKELDVDLSRYDDVIVNNASYQGFGQIDPEEEIDMGSSQPVDGKLTLITTKQSVARRGSVVFTNDCSDDNSKPLFVEKVMGDTVAAEGTPITDAFDVKIWMEETESGKLQPYTGEYYLIGYEGQEKHYYKYQIPDGGTEPVLTDLGTTTPKKEDCDKAEDGMVKIPAGYMVETNQVIAGTAFAVQEPGLDKALYEDPVIAVTEGDTTIDSSVTNGDVESIGQTELRKGATVQVTNTPVTQYTWEIIKKSSSSDEVAPLDGARFTLTSVPAEGGTPETYIGVSAKETGKIEWSRQVTPEGNEEPTLTPVPADSIPKGTYELRETAAPMGYALSGDVWTITLDNSGIVITRPSATPGGTPEAINASDSSGQDENGKTIYTYHFYNAVLYELPSTGGIGIHWYIVSGTLMMMAGILILYKRKYAGRC